MSALEYLILVLRVIAGRSQGVSYETRDDATRLAAPAAAGPTYRARRTAEGIASLAPHDAELQHERAREAGPDARAETRRPRRPIEVNTRAGEVASTATATPAAHYRRLRSIRPCCRGSMWRAPGGDCAAQNKKNRVWPQGDSTLPPQGRGRILPVRCTLPERAVFARRPASPRATT